MSPNLKSPLWKQLLGGTSGALIALALYGAYTIVDGPVQSLLSSVFAQDPESVYTAVEREARQQQIIERAKQILQTGTTEQE